MGDELQLKLPDGYRARSPRLDVADTKAVCHIDDQVSAAAGQQRQSDPVDLRNEWESQMMRDLTTSVRLIEDEAGMVVAYAELWDGRKPPVYPWLSWGVLPELAHTPLATAILDWLDATAQRALADCPADVRVALRTSIVSGYAPMQQVLEAHGFQPIRESFRMRIDMTTPPPTSTLPKNITIRPYKHPDELDALIAADDDGFRDHWGYVERDVAQLRDEWSHWLDTHESFDPDLFFLAIDTTTNTIAGVCLCFNKQTSDPDVAYVDSLAVRKAYRRQGLGLALLHHTFQVFWQRGRKSVALHVDGASLTGATRLYERAGMHVDQKEAIFEKLLRDGVELSTVAVES